MSIYKTSEALAAITDEGLFESLATAVLRRANPIYGSLVHTGVNKSGKTVKAPLDGLCFVQGAAPPHMIAFHHTITARKDLSKKWLLDPAGVKPRKSQKSTPVAGDLIKTGKLVAEERKRTANLLVTLVLTTNQEPDEVLVRDVMAAGHKHGLEIDIWSLSRLSDFLDNEPSGQWLRHTFLNIDQELLSEELLLELSQSSLNHYLPSDDPATWVPRTLDDSLKNGIRRDVTFLVAESGLGKSVACYKLLAAYLKQGRSGIVLSDETIANAGTLEQAVMMTLHQLHPPLSSVNDSAFSLCSPERPLFLFVEDVNRSGQPQRLVEKIIGWISPLEKDNGRTRSCWRLVCPLWPEVIASLREQTRKQIEKLIVETSVFSERESCTAVQARARHAGRAMSALKAKEIAQALGHDPLLIALHDQSQAPNPQEIIGQFIETCLSSTAAEYRDHPSADYRQAVNALAAEILKNRQVELRWREFSGWKEIQGEPLMLLSRLAFQGKLIRFSGRSDNQRLLFRHDRVKDLILADTILELSSRDLLTDDLLAEPYFAEVMGIALVSGQYKPDFLQSIAALNPLALFYALRLIGRKTEKPHQPILQAINAWVDNPMTHESAFSHLRWEALAILAETDSPIVPELARKFRDRTSNDELARFRNGDLSGGIELCSYVEPGAGAPWRDIQIEHVKLIYGPNLARALSGVLMLSELNTIARTGAVRLAGHIADPALAPAIEACWNKDDERVDRLADYIWAFGECCGKEPARFLEKACDIWASLSNKSEKQGLPSPRDELAANGLRWAFRRFPPLDAIEYFVQRGSQDDLRWPITYMLHGMDHPKAVLFVVNELAKIRRSIEGTSSFSPFVSSASDDWRRAQDDGHPMSKLSRDILLELWQDKINDKHLRIQAFSLWAATNDPDDLKVLHSAGYSDILADNILRECLARGDKEAIPMMIEKIASDERGIWWYPGRYIWAPELTTALDQYLERRKDQTKGMWGSSVESDEIIHELIMRLPINEAEQLLIKHWEYLRFIPYFVQTALFISTPSLLEAASTAITECPDPAKMLAHLGMNWGIRITNYPGITSEAQIRGLTNYLNLLSPMDIMDLWMTCNDHGWFVLRREMLDSHLQEPYTSRKWDREQIYSEFDKMISGSGLFWVGSKIDQIMDVGISWEEICETLVQWLDERRTFNALRVVAAVIEHRGSREDISSLRIYEGMPEVESKQLIMDTTFAVYRRSIH